MKKPCFLSFSYLSRFFYPPLLREVVHWRYICMLWATTVFNDFFFLAWFHLSDSQAIDKLSRICSERTNESQFTIVLLLLSNFLQTVSQIKEISPWRQLFPFVNVIGILGIFRLLFIIFRPGITDVLILPLMSDSASYASKLSLSSITP